jgi:hypothetical protein
MKTSFATSMLFILATFGAVQSQTVSDAPSDVPSSAPTMTGGGTGSGGSPSAGGSGGTSSGTRGVSAAGRQCVGPLVAGLSVAAGAYFMQN